MFFQYPGAGLFVAGVMGAAATIILIQLMSVIAPHIGLVDLPNERKVHEGAVPLVGGLALCSAYLLVALFMLPDSALFLPVTAGIVLLGVGGLFDDIFELSARVRLLLQVLAAVIVVAGAGLQLHSLGNLAALGNVQLSTVAGFLFTVFCIVSLVNGLNMLDGLDGLAGGVGAIMMGGFIIAGAVMDLVPQVAHMTVFLSCLLGFLVLHNARSPLRRRLVFMGDAGSMVLGFLLACMAIYLAEHPSKGSMYPVTAVWIMGLVVLDTVSTVVRRVLKGRNPLAPGRDHLHHLLLDLGVRGTRVVAIMYAATAMMAAAGLAGWFLGVPEYFLAGAFGIVALLYYAGVSYGWRRVKRRHNVVAFIPSRPAPTRIEHEPEELDVRAG